MVQVIDGLIILKKIIDETGFSYLWLQQTISPKEVSAICQILHNQALQNINSSANVSGKGRTYIYLKSSWEMEHYLTTLDFNKTYAILRFRTGNHKFPIELGRHIGLRTDERRCPHCVNNAVGDEFHYLLECRKSTKERKKYINEKYLKRPNMFKYFQLMNTKDHAELCKLGTFIALLIKNVH